MHQTVARGLNLIEPESQQILNMDLAEANADC